MSPNRFLPSKRQTIKRSICPSIFFCFSSLELQVCWSLRCHKVGLHTYSQFKITSRFSICVFALAEEARKPQRFFFKLPIPWPAIFQYFWWGFFFVCLLLFFVLQISYIIYAFLHSSIHFFIFFHLILFENYVDWRNVSVFKYICGHNSCKNSVYVQIMTGGVCTGKYLEFCICAFRTKVSFICINVDVWFA